MEENLTSVNAEQVSDESSQIEQAVESVNEGVATSQQEKPVQDAYTNAMFAKVRRESESKAKDAVIAEMYGESHGIYTYADYRKALEKQQEEEDNARLQQETGIDPKSLEPIFKKWKETDPDFQEVKAMRAEKNTMKALTDLNNELKEAGIDLQIKDLSNEEMAKIPNIDKVTEYVQKGHSLADAFFLANKKTIIEKQSKTAEQETIKKIASNAESSPGSLSAGGGESDFISSEMFEKNKHDQRWVIKNLTKITKSRTKW